MSRKEGEMMFSENALRDRQLKKKLPSFIWAAARLILLIGISYTVLYPILAKLSLVFMDAADLSDYSVKWIPRHFTLSNVKVAFEILDYWKSLSKTIGICLLISALQVTVCTLSAYGFARFRSKGRKILFGVVLATLLIPPQTYIVTLYTQFQHFDILGIISLINGRGGINLLDTLWTFILLSATGMGIRSGLYIYVEKQTFSALPKELEEAAKVDGAGMFRTFYSVMLPNAVPTIVMCFILSFVWQWNDTFYTTYFNATLGTLSMKIKSMSSIVSEYLGGWGLRGTANAQLLISVGVFLCVIPLILLFIFCQRFFVQGVERSGLVG